MSTKIRISQTIRDCRRTSWLYLQYIQSIFSQRRLSVSIIWDKKGNREESILFSLYGTYLLLARREATGVWYLGVTHAVLIIVQTDRFQDDLGRPLWLAWIWHGIGAQNFVSASVCMFFYRVGWLMMWDWLWYCGWVWFIRAKYTEQKIITLG